jgi:hypothetical protein
MILKVAHYQNFAPNEMQNRTRWYQQMFERARVHLGQH